MGYAAHVTRAAEWWDAEDDPITLMRRLHRIATDLGGLLRRLLHRL